MTEPHLTLVENHEREPHPPRCPHCHGIVRLDFDGIPLPNGTGWCPDPKHNVVRYYRRVSDER